MMDRNIMRIIFCAFVAIAVVGCARRTVADPALFTVAEEDKQAARQFADVNGTELTEVKYGNKVYLEIASAGVIVNDEKIDKYVRAIRERLVRDVERPSLPYVISVIKDTRIYAVSTPGGFIYVSTGMLCHVKTESELAAVLAHEVVQTQYKPQSFRLSKRIFGFFRSLSGYTKMFVPYGFGVPQGMRVFDRLVLGDVSSEKAVISADAGAFKILESAGYRQQGLGEMIDGLIDTTGDAFVGIEMYLKHRPLSDARIDAVHALVKNVPVDDERRTLEGESYARVKEYVQQL